MQSRAVELKHKPCRLFSEREHLQKIFANMWTKVHTTLLLFSLTETSPVMRSSHPVYPLYRFDCTIFLLYVLHVVFAYHFLNLSFELGMCVICFMSAMYQFTDVFDFRIVYTALQYTLQGACKALQYASLWQKIKLDPHPACPICRPQCIKSTSVNCIYCPVGVPQSHLSHLRHRTVTAWIPQ